MKKMKDVLKAHDNPFLPGVFDVEPEAVQENMRSPEVVIVDVRSPAEYKGELGHVPGSQLMVLDTLDQRIQELPKDKAIIFVCRSGGRSARASAFAMSLGFTEVYNMQGGMIRWNERGFKTEK